MISDDFKCIFVHIPRCAGTSIDFFFKNYGGNTIDCFHDTIDMIKAKYPIKFKKYFKFTFVRNTWDRILSWYFYHRDSEKISPYKDMSFREWIKRGMPIHKTWFWKKWQKEGGSDPLNQMEYISDELDFIGRFENLENDFEKVLDWIGIKYSKLPHLRKTKKRDYRNFYDEETRKLVERKFKEEIEYFGYRFYKKDNFINKIISWLAK